MNASLNTKLSGLYCTLGIPADYLEKRALPLYEEGRSLVWVDGCDGPYQLNNVVATAWESMLKAAQTDGIEVFLVSGYRSYQYQAGLIRTKLDAGEAICDILQVVAPPGCSQHHTGCAIDLGTPGSEYLEEDFETTDAFAWLRTHAAGHGFVMPFTKGNTHGFIYEPWHWYYQGKSKG